MGRLRVLWKAPTLAILTLLTVVSLVLSSWVLGLVRGGGWAGSATARWRAAIFLRWSRAVCAVLGIVKETEGSPPKPPFFLVSNHLSYVDIPVLASSSPCAFVTRGDVENWPLVGFICRCGGSLFIDRGNKRDIPRVLEDIEQVLGDRRGIVVFPEGTSTRGAEVGPFRPSLLEAAAAAGIPVFYAALSYRTPAGSAPAHLAVCWWGDMTLGGHLLDLLALPRIEARVSYGEEPIVEHDRKALARRLHGAVEQRFQPVV